MNTMKVHHWQDPVIALLGAWLAASPWALMLERSVVVLAANLVLGLGLLALALGSLFAPRRWERWSEAVLGLAVAVSPWLLGFADDPLAWRNAVTVGLVSGLLALWAMCREGEFRMWSHRRTAH